MPVFHRFDQCFGRYGGYFLSDVGLKFIKGPWLVFASVELCMGTNANHDAICDVKWFVLCPTAQIDVFEMLLETSEHWPVRVRYYHPIALVAFYLDAWD